MKTKNKKLDYAVRMYKFHTRLVNKHLKVIQDCLEKNGIAEPNLKKKIGSVVDEGQVTIFDFSK